MTRSVFRICQTKRSKPHSMDRPSTAAKARPSASNDFIEERRTGRRKLMSVLQRGDHPVVRELSRLGRSLGVRRGRARPDLRSAPRRGLALGQVLGAEALGPPERAPRGVFTARMLSVPYVARLSATYAGRVPAAVDLVCYWFEKAGRQIASGKAARVGLVATNSIRGGANRRAAAAYGWPADITEDDALRELLEGIRGRPEAPRRMLAGAAETEPR